MNAMNKSEIKSKLISRGTLEIKDKENAVLSELPFSLDGENILYIIKLSVNERITHNDISDISGIPSTRVRKIMNNFFQNEKISDYILREKSGHKFFYFPTHNFICDNDNNIPSIYNTLRVPKKFLKKNNNSKPKLFENLVKYMVENKFVCCQDAVKKLGMTEKQFRGQLSLMKVTPIKFCLKDRIFNDTKYYYFSLNYDFILRLGRTFYPEYHKNREKINTSLVDINNLMKSGKLCLIFQQ